MKSIRQSFCFPLFQPKVMSRLDLFKKARAIGYEAVELWGIPVDFEAIAADAKQAGLKLSSATGHNSIDEGMNCKKNHDRIEAELMKSMEVAVKYQIPGLIGLAGSRKQTPHDEEGRATTAAFLKKMAKSFEKAGVNLNLELLNSKVDHPGYQCDHTEWGVDVIKRVNSSRVKVLYDIYHMQIMEGDIIRTIRENIQHIGHFHTAGNPGRNDMDNTQEMNYRGICRAIAESAYEGFVGHEFSPKGDPVEGLRGAFEECKV